MSDHSTGKSSSRRLPKEPLIVAAIIVVVSVLIAVGGVVYKTRDQVQKDKLEFLADTNAKQVAPLRRVIQLRLAQDRARLVQFAATRSALGPGRARTFGDFAVVSLMTMGAGGQWGVSWIEKGPLFSQMSTAQKWQGEAPVIAPDQEIALLKSLPYERLREGDVHWQRMSDGAGRPLWALAISVETQAGNNPVGALGGALPDGVDYHSVPVGSGGRAVVVGFFARNPLLSATEDFIGSTSTAFVIDSRGYVATHSDKEVVGALLRDDPAVKEIFSARSSAGATRYENAEGEKIFAAFEQVDRTNLYVVMSTPESVVGNGVQKMTRSALTAGGLAVIVGLMLVFAWGARLLPRVSSGFSASPSAGSGGVRITGRVSDGPPSGLNFDGDGATPVGMTRGLSRPASPSVGRPLNQGDPMATTLELPAEMQRPMVASVRSSSEPPIAAPSDAKEIAEFLEQFVRGFESSLKEPLLAALAHVQLAKAKSSDKHANEKSSKAGLQEIAEHVVSVERDLRRAKETVDELGRLAAESKPPSADERADVSAMTKGAVEKMRSGLEASGIDLQVKIHSTPSVRGRESALSAVVEELLTNARRALNNRNSKKISVKLEDVGDSVMLSVVDNGIGMDRETRAKAFDPFFVSFDDMAAKGLGLAKVRAILKGHSATCELVSAPGDGTTVVVRWPVTDSDRRSFEQARAKRAAEKAEKAEKAERAAPEPVEVARTESSVPKVPGSAAVSPSNPAEKAKAPPEVPAAKARAPLQAPSFVAKPEYSENTMATEVTSNQTMSAMTGAVDFSNEGAIAFGGRAPLPPEQAASLPPPPRPGGGDEEDDEHDETWVLSDPRARLSQPEIVGAMTEQELILEKEHEDTVTIRPVRRG